MTPEGHALSIKPAEGKQIVPADLTEFASWLKRDPLRCYVAVDAFTDVAMQQLFAVQTPVKSNEELLANAIGMVTSEQAEEFYADSGRGKDGE
jgi:hypothetical protein